MRWEEVEGRVSKRTVLHVTLGSYEQRTCLI